MESICVCVGKQKRCLRIKDTFAWVWVLWVGESCHIPWHSVIRVAFAGTKVGEMFVFSVKLLCAAIIRGFIQNWNICWVSLWKLYNNRTKSGGSAALGCSICPFPDPLQYSRFLPLCRHTQFFSLTVCLSWLNLFLWRRVRQSTCSQQTAQKVRQQRKQRLSSPLSFLWGSFQFQFRSKLKLERCPVLRIRTVVCGTLPGARCVLLAFC